MSLLLCKKGADTPFYSETMNLRLWSLQELCYVIYHYPLLALQDFLSPELLNWLRDELSLGYLTARIAQIRAVAEAAGNDGTDDALTEILRDCNYYTAGEVEACRRKLAFYRGLKQEDQIHARGVSYFKLKRYRAAIRCFEEENELLSEQERRAEERTRKRFRQRRAGVFCDIASARAVLFEKKEALLALSKADALSPVKRSAELRCLIDSLPEEAPAEEPDPAETEALPPAETEKLLQRVEEAKKKAEGSQNYQALLQIEGLDAVKRKEALQKVLREWKKEYRCMN